MIRSGRLFFTYPWSSPLEGDPLFKLRMLFYEYMLYMVV